jgi:metal-dependent amidase/aminoacylase/carboxypeptidase family protein
LGRLNYFSDGMIRCEIICHVRSSLGRIHRYPPNAILVLNEVINRILELKLPLKPRTQIIFGTISGGLKHGQIPKQAILGLEIHSDSDQMVASVYTEIRDIVRAMAHEYEVGLRLSIISNVRAARLKYDHPLVKGALSILERLGIEPHIGPSESELSIFLSRHIPSLTIGISLGQEHQKTKASMQIEPMFKGIAQIIGILKLIDSGVCDE